MAGQHRVDFQNGATALIECDHQNSIPRNPWVKGSHAVQSQCPLGFLQRHFRGIANTENVIPLLCSLLFGKKFIPKPFREVCLNEHLLLGQTIAADDLVQVLGEGFLLIDHVARVFLKEVLNIVRGGIAQDVFQFFCRFLFQGISPFAENVI